MWVCGCARAVSVFGRVELVCGHQKAILINKRGAHTLIFAVLTNNTLARNFSSLIASDSPLFFFSQKMNSDVSDERGKVRQKQGMVTFGGD